MSSLTGQLRARLEASLAAARDREALALRKHVLAIACYRGTEDDLLEEAFKEVHDRAGRQVLLAIFNAVRSITEADYYRERSALCDGDATADVAEAQIREARENRDKCLDNMIARLLREVPQYIEAPLGRFAAGDVAWGGLAVNGLASKIITAAAIRELFGGAPDQGSPDVGVEVGRVGRVV